MVVLSFNPSGNGRMLVAPRIPGLVRVLALACFFVGAAAPAVGSQIIVQSTTSTRNSGLYGHILPMIESDTGVTAKVVAVGTGAAIRNAMNCDADVLLVHSREREDRFIADGFATRRYDVMYNDYVVIGPKHDPAGIRNLTDAVEAFRRIGRTRSLFASRGDESGTHDRERAIWDRTGIDHEAASGTWYLSTGSGMGATINTAVGMAAYTLADRATWAKFGNKADFDILVEGDPPLFNPYGVMLVNPEKCPGVKAEAGQAFIDWLVSPEGQAAIAGYTVAGEAVFFPNANADSEGGSDKDD